MRCAQQGSVTEGSSYFPALSKKLGKLDTAECRLAENFCHSVHFGRNRGIILIKVCVVSSRINYAKLIALPVHRKIYLFNDG